MFPPTQKHVLWVKRSGVFRLSHGTTFSSSRLSAAVHSKTGRCARQPGGILHPASSPRGTASLHLIAGRQRCSSRRVYAMGPPLPAPDSSTLCPQSLDLQKWKEGGTQNRSPGRSVVTLCRL